MGHGRANPSFSSSIEAARMILRHNSAAVTEIYAEKDAQEAIETIMKIG